MRPFRVTHRVRPADLQRGLLEPLSGFWGVHISLAFRDASFHIQRQSPRTNPSDTHNAPSPAFAQKEMLRKK
jgi:hypothetical protein